ncbi:MAG: AAA family ATPase [Xenococcaceae cyanobacterium MO_207.B15]|nr:AAA family ATPase [Xenococcaceae cyanobacterium MO_207.B15]
MVHIKSVELNHFKSFGGSTKIPLLPGFTVVSGPNGSGKSNILDALLFCLGLSGSKGMRAERLPDLINNKHTSNGRVSETIVSVTFDLTDLADLDNLVTKVNLNPPEAVKDLNENELVEESPPNQEGEETAAINNGQLIAISNNGSWEWKVTRRLRVNKKGNYASTFYINGQVVTATELHEQLEKLRIYPEGYNVVLQGDVTRIINMNTRERREIIDELAGVAAFDRKIDQTKRTLEKVKEREEHCQIIEQELISSKERLAADRIKAEKYQKLKQQIQEKKQQEIILVWRSLFQQQEELHTAIAEGNKELGLLTEELQHLERDITENSTNLEELNRLVKALGEEEQLSVASELATQKAKRHQLQQRQEELQATLQQKQLSLVKTQESLTQYQQEFTQLTEVKNRLESETVPELSRQYKQARTELTERREMADVIAAASEAWVQEQASLTREISLIQNNLNPQRTEQATITEKLSQLYAKITEETDLLATVTAELSEKQNLEQTLSDSVITSANTVQDLAQKLSEAESDRSIQQDTQQRLLKEQRDKQRQLDKLEATKQAQQEAQGTYASKVILNANLSGVHGLVVQLGEVETRYQLALETAAGGRLGYIVVENDTIAAAGIELLKQQRAGRATFLPLNKIQSPRLMDISSLRNAQGFIDLAVNLINSESRYQKIFAYVFGNTIIFDTLDNARYHLGKYRIVTLSGEILETSGAMTGGSKSTRSSLHFGKVTTNESREVEILRERLTEIESILSDIERIIEQDSIQVKNLTESVTEARQSHREKQLRLEQLQKEIGQLSFQQEQLTNQINHHQKERDNLETRSQFLVATIPSQENQLQQLQQKLDELEASHDQSEWQQIQTAIKNLEQDLQTKETQFRTAENKLKDTINQHQRITEKIAEAQQHIKELQEEETTINNQQSTINNQLQELSHKIIESEHKLQQLTERLKETKEQRDRTENQLKKRQTQQQKKSWQKEKLQTTQEERNNTLVSLQAQLQEQEQELNTIKHSPEQSTTDPELLWKQLEQQLFTTKQESETPTITHAILQEKLEELQKQIRRGEKKLEAMEPVNMLALEEYEKTEARLKELSEKLSTIAAERTELLLRVEKFTTLRLRAFKEAYDAVNQNFQAIFAELSDGDGHLQLEDENDPFNGGLNLVAHPKGKPVQRLSSMSGGEKSLTALSFIFSLQKYRPSSFYAFDEVDMFLDGANVARLSKMVKQQAQEAQFIVVSLRRPMIEASERTIGVTQARGAHTQVLGIKL